MNRFPAGMLYIFFTANQNVSISSKVLFLSYVVLVFCIDFIEDFQFVKLFLFCKKNSFTLLCIIANRLCIYW